MKVNNRNSCLPGQEKAAQNSVKLSQNHPELNKKQNLSSPLESHTQQRKRLRALYLVPEMTEMAPFDGTPNPCSVYLFSEDPLAFAIRFRNAKKGGTIKGL
ncbi:MAG: hypothetical protein JXX14_23795 [Deltaproteobacteria bacterium]|nr:hypothetical protein [Deltaproteobacteria bacterium]